MRPPRQRIAVTLTGRGPSAKLRATRAPARTESPALRIAKPILLVTTPVGVAWGIYEAAKVRWWLALLMAALVAVIGGFFWLTVSRIRAERRDARGAGPR